MQSSTVLVLFIIFMVIAVFLILLLSIILIRNLYFKRSNQYADDLRIRLQREATSNKDAIQKCQILAKNDHKFVKICDDLKTTNALIVQQKDEIIDGIFKLKSIINEKKWKQTIQSRKGLRQQETKYNAQNQKFQDISKEFEISWKVIDDVFTNYLEIVDSFKDVLTKNKNITPNLNASLTNKVQLLAKKLNDLDNQKYRGQFSQADKKIEELRKRLNELYNLMIGANRIEYYLFDNLPKQIQASLKQEKDAKIKPLYQKLAEQTQKLIDNWESLDSATIELNIKKLYKDYFTIFNTLLLNEKLITFNKKVKSDLILIYKERTALYNKVSQQTSKLNKSYNTLQNKYNAMANSKLPDFIQNVKEFLSCAKEFDINYNNVKLALYQADNDKKQKEVDLLNSIEVYFSVIQNDMLPQDENITKVQQETTQQFETNIKKYKSWNKHALVWDSYIHNLAVLTKQVALNEKYREFYNAMCLEIASNEKFLLTNEKLNAYKELIDQIRIQIQQNNNYQQAYNSLKKFLIKEKYVQQNSN
ncbi:hypothetical protein [Mycoplasma seminis]|uniref:Septation ring formation regulator EzrA n=1 Tax=Mycoplasma seminis TaxID=512749 RepID=A0ABY9HB97_9MOLU|nr:hypothetical protein [Mycoplasma seminis]WLP85618.1 hypothetical protein Q8852_00435 [Mycoplasma seminis]